MSATPRYGVDIDPAFEVLFYRVGPVQRCCLVLGGFKADCLMFGIFGDTNPEATVMGGKKLHREVVGAITGDEEWLCVIAVKEAKPLDLALLPSQRSAAIGCHFNARCIEKLANGVAHIWALTTQF